MGDPSSDRARARRSWPVTRLALGQEPGDDLGALTTATERLGMMWELARAAWGLSGCAIPTYDRRHAPGRLIRRTP